MTLAGDRTVVEEQVIADGVERTITEPACSGRRRAEWSRDGERFFSTAELTCDNEPARKVSGVTLISDKGEWIDIQVVRISGRENVRVRRYSRSSDQPPGNSGLSEDLVARAEHASRRTPLDIDDVIEATGKVSSPAIEAALLETNATFRLDRRSLLAMGDARVSPAVIDLMVALSYPTHFQVHRSSGSSSSSGWPGVGFADWDWFGFDPFYSYYAFFSPFRYYDPYWYYYGNGGSVIVEPPPDSGDHGGPHGRVVNGAGYTQISPRPPESATPRGGGGNQAGAASASSSSSSGSSATSSGYSSGGGGGDTGHTAVPR